MSEVDNRINGHRCFYPALNSLYCSMIEYINRKIPAGYTLTVTLFVVAVLLCATSTCSAIEAPELNESNTTAYATPTIDSTSESVSTGNIVPDDIKTMEDYEMPFSMNREGEKETMSIWRVLLSLIIVVVLIIGVIYVMKLFYARGMRYDLKGKHIKVLDVVTLGTNKSLHLVAVGSKIILLGSSEKGMVYLTELTSEKDSGDILGEWRDKGSVGFQGELETAVEGIDAGSVEPAQPVPFVEKLKEKLKRLEDDKKPE